MRYFDNTLIISETQYRIVDQRDLYKHCEIYKI